MTSVGITITAASGVPRPRDAAVTEGDNGPVTTLSYYQLTAADSRWVFRTPITIQSLFVYNIVHLCLYMQGLQGVLWNMFVDWCVCGS